MSEFFAQQTGEAGYLQRTGVGDDPQLWGGIMDIGMGRETRSSFFSVLVVVFVADSIALGNGPLLVGDDVAHGSHGW